MKILIIRKKHIFLFTIIILFIATSSIIVFKNTYPKEESAFNPIDNAQTSTLDLTGDGIEDSLKVISEDGNIDIQIISKNRIFNLSKSCSNNILLNDSKSWPAKVYFKKLSRKKVPEIIVQGCKDKSPVQYIFTWINGKFENIFESKKNILGILDSNENRTPQIYSLNSSSGNSSLESYMIIKNELLDITNDCKTIPDLSNVIALIDIIQKDYEVEDIPDIFKEGIPENELGLLWNLDKEHNTYSFQDAFFYDENVNKENTITTLKWRITFEKYVKSQSDSSKSELVFYVTTERTYDGSYKISSLYIK